MIELPLLLRYRTARQSGLTVQQVTDLWAAFIAQFAPLQRAVEGAWTDTTVIAPALDVYLAWRASLPLAAQPVVDGWVTDYAASETVRTIRANMQQAVS